MKRHRTADLEPINFGGRYRLIRRLAVGGMAEIYLARQAAMAGFEKEVVIKRLRAELADDPRIVEMFLDEARIGALLNHPNIVHVYDVDEHDGIPYIAMEYIVGEELNELCRRGIQHDRFLPLEHAVELMRQAASGMGYFHAKRGAEGTETHDRPLEIVHFDISPSNLLVTQDGFLKVIDFGIARALGQQHRGETLPGKLSYMSPEQAAPRHEGGGAAGNAASVDHRSDIFSLGIVLYEITVGRRLFRGNATEVVAKLSEATVEPPTFVRRNFPPALEAIVMRTLERHPGDRYQSAYDLADDLETFLRDERLHSGPVRIARYLDMLTHMGGGARRAELVSEAEARGASDDLDFDKSWESFEPIEGAPGPAQAREWEDTEQPEADVAAALGMELEELRLMRTPVPVRPAGMAPLTGRESQRGIEPPPPTAAEEAVDDEPAPTAPRRAITDDGEHGDAEHDDGFDDGDAGIADDESEDTVDVPPSEEARAKSKKKKRATTDEGDGEEEIPTVDTPVQARYTPTTEPVLKPAPMPQTRPRTPIPLANPRAITRDSKPIGKTGVPSSIGKTGVPSIDPVPARPIIERPAVGGALLARSQASKLPWLIVGVLGLLVLVLVVVIAAK